MKANPSSSKFSQYYNRLHSYVQTRGFKHDAPAMSSYELSVSIVSYSQSGKQNQQIYVFCNCFFYISESTNFFCELLSCANFQNYLLIMVAPRSAKFILLRAFYFKIRKITKLIHTKKTTHPNVATWRGLPRRSPSNNQFKRKGKRLPSSTDLFIQNKSFVLPFFFKSTANVNLQLSTRPSLPDSRSLACQRLITRTSRFRAAGGFRPRSLVLFDRQSLSGKRDCSQSEHNLFLESNSQEKTNKPFFPSQRQCFNINSLQAGCLRNIPASSLSNV